MIISSSETQKCPECGRPLEVVEMAVASRTYHITRPCSCQVDKRQAEEEERKKRERQRLTDRLFAVAELGPRFQECTFETWIQKPGSAKAYAEIRRYAEEFEQNTGDGLLVFGVPGNGKSHLAAAVVNYLIPRGFSCIFRSSPALLKQLQNSYGSASRYSESDILNVLEKADLLVLDDLGAEQSRVDGGKYMMTPWAETMLYHIIDSRYRWKRPIIVTTNCSIEELEARIGERTFDRILEMCLLVENSAVSYRREQAEKRMRGFR